MGIYCMSRSASAEKILQFSYGQHDIEWGSTHGTIRGHDEREA